MGLARSHCASREGLRYKEAMAETSQERPKESAWDYPRPPRLEPEPRRVRVVVGGKTIADSTRALRVLETSSPPTIYVPFEDVATEHLEPAGGETVCEWKGRASYHSVRVGDRLAERAGWTYPEPDPRYPELKNHIAFYAGRVDECYLGDERVQPQEGDFYGGWITAEIDGPFKGGSGRLGW